MIGRCFVFLAVISLAALPLSHSLAKRPFWSFLSGGASNVDKDEQELAYGDTRSEGGFMSSIKRTAAADNFPYTPLPLDEKEESEAYLSESAVERQRKKASARKKRETERNKQFDTEYNTDNQEHSYSSHRWNVFDLQNVIPKVNFRCDPLVNFKLKQRLVVLGACVTLGMDYLSDIAQWRSYCAVEDAFVQGRFSLRGSELGWAKSWLLNLGMGEEHTAKFKLRMGLNLRSYKAYAKLRFRTEPISPFDIGEGLSCAGKLPLPVHVLPLLKNVPLRIEYRLRLNAGRPDGEQCSPENGVSNDSNEYGENKLSSGSSRMRRNRDKKVFMSSGLGTLDVSLDELNFCLEWDEKSPVWGLGVVRGGPPRKGLSGLRAPSGYASFSSADASGTGGDKKKNSVMVPRGGQQAQVIGRNTYGRSNNAS